MKGLASRRLTRAFQVLGIGVEFVLLVSPLPFRCGRLVSVRLLVEFVILPVHFLSARDALPWDLLLVGHWFSPLFPLAFSSSE